MNEQEARLIERQLTSLLPGCLVEAYETTEPDYETRQFVSTWHVSVYSSMEKLGNIVCIIWNQKHHDAFLAVCASYYHRRREIEEDAYHVGESFVDQNGKTIIRGQVYTREEYEQL